MANQTKVDMTNTAPAGPVTTIAHAAVSAPAPKAIPTITQSVHVDPGSAVSSLVALIERYRKPAENAADKLEDFAFSKVPFGTIIESFVGPHLAAQYVDQVINYAEAMAQATGTSVVNNPGALLQLGINALITAESWVGALGFTAAVEGWIKGALAKVGLSVQ